MDSVKPLRSFGRRKGRNLRPAKQGLFDTLLPQLRLEASGLGLMELFPQALRPKPHTPVWLEIGFGGGEHLAHLAGLHPEVQFIGCEPYVNGTAGLLSHINEHGLKNIRIYNDDARDLVAALPDNSLERVYILYPDPWPKARHNKRRIISTEFLDSLVRVMKPGAELRLATDSADYATWMLERLLTHPGLAWKAKNCKDWLEPWEEWISTRYEQKALAGRPTYLDFERQ